MTDEREEKQREMHDLLTFVQGQIHGKELFTLLLLSAKGRRGAEALLG